MSSSHLDEFEGITETVVYLFRNSLAIPCRVQIPYPQEELILESSSSSDEPPEYMGDIIEVMPDEVWAEDKWNEQREEEAIRRIQQQGKFLSPYYRKLYTEKANRYWHEFYKRNKDHFYKDRHYLHKIFPELKQSSGNSSINLLEIGCGVGNAVLPLIELNQNLNVIAVDFAPSAIKILSSNPVAVENSHRFVCSVCNITADELPVSDGWADLVLCFFVLSAIAPELYDTVATKIHRVLKANGKVLIRDYGRYDEAQLRFKKGRRLEENFYVRQDGTCAYYFGLDDLRKVFSCLREEKCEFVLRQQANRKLQKARYRVWIEAVFSKQDRLIIKG